jgi:hypothetical protein
MTRLFFVVFLLTGERAAADGVVVTDPRTDQYLSVGWAGGDVPGVWVSYFDGRGRGWTFTVHRPLMLPTGEELVVGWWAEFSPRGPCHLALSIDRHRRCWLQWHDPLTETTEVIQIGGRK